MLFLPFKFQGPGHLLIILADDIEDKFFFGLIPHKAAPVSWFLHGWSIVQWQQHVIRAPISILQHLWLKPSSISGKDLCPQGQSASQGSQYWIWRIAHNAAPNVFPSLPLLRGKCAAFLFNQSNCVLQGSGNTHRCNQNSPSSLCLLLTPRLLSFFRYRAMGRDTFADSFPPVAPYSSPS